MKRGIFIVYLLLLAALIFISQSLGVNIGASTIARLATIESLVERHTYVIDDSSLPRSLDMVLVKGHFYGCQPPLLQTILAPVYLFIHRAGGLSMAKHLRLVYALLTISTVGILSSLMVAFFYGLMSGFGLDRSRSLLATFTFGLGTLVLPYSTGLNAQIIGGALIFFAIYLVLRGLGRGGAFFAGLLMGAASTIDMPAGGIFSATFLFYLMLGRSRRRFLLPALLGWTIPFVLHCAINVPIMGSVRPGGLIPEYFNYPTSEFDSASLGGVATHESVAVFLSYVYHSLVGHRGFFSYSPVLLFPLAALLSSVFSRRKGVLRDESLSVLAAIILTMMYYLLKTINYGGWTYGMRFFVPLVPPLAIYMGPFLAQPRRLLIRCIFIVCLIISIAITFIGTLNPWSDLFIGPNPIVNNLTMAFGNMGLRPPAALTGLAMSIDEGDSKALYYLGKKFNLYGWKDVARDAFLRAVHADSADPFPRLSLANAYYGLGEFAVARREYEHLRSGHPDYMSAVQEYDIARGVNVIRIAAEDVAARKNMALLLIESEREEEAGELIRDYLDNGDGRLRERYRRECDDIEVEVVYPPMYAELLHLLKLLEEGEYKNMKTWKLERRMPE